MFTGPGFFQVDMGLFKNFSNGRTRLELRMEVFNLFDTVNFSHPKPLVPRCSGPSPRRASRRGPSSSA